MKNNKLTPGGNLVWEGSRMMLPEHKQELIEERVKLKRITKPELTEEEQKEMFVKLRMSIAERLDLTVTIIDEYENSRYTGMITGLDPHQYLVNIKLNHDWKVIDFKNIVGVEWYFAWSPADLVNWFRMSVNCQRK